MLTHGFGPKMAIFPTFFLGNIGQKNFVYDILERENAFLPYKNKKLKNSRLSIQGVQKVVKLTFFQRAMVLVQKWPFSELYFLANIGQKNIFYDILERKNAFLRNKNRKFKKSKN